MSECEKAIKLIKEVIREKEFRSKDLVEGGVKKGSISTVMKRLLKMRFIKFIREDSEPLKTTSGAARFHVYARTIIEKFPVATRPVIKPPVAMAAPKGSQYFIDGSFYKVSKSGVAFIHDSIEWIKSSKQSNQVLCYNGTAKQLKSYQV